MLAAMALLAGGAVHADSSMATGADSASASARLAIVVTVPTHLSLRVLQLPRLLRVTPDDIARGYLEAPTPVDLVVHSNLREGYRLLLSTTSPVIQRVVLTGDGTVIEAAAHTVVPRAAEGRGLRSSRLAWRARFYLSSNAAPGDIVWPLNVGLAP